MVAPTHAIRQKCNFSTAWELWLYWAALQDLYALPGVCGGGAFAAACAKLSAFLDESEAEEQRRKAAVTWRELGGQ